MTDLVASLVGVAGPGSDGFRRVQCPFCPERVGKVDRKSCLSASLSTGWWRCWRCAKRGRLPGFEGLPSAALPQREEAPAVTVRAPRAWYPLFEGDPGETLQPAKRYVQRSRGVDPQVGRAAKIGACAAGRYYGYVVVPVLDEVGDWLGWVARAWGQSERPHDSMRGPWKRSVLYRQDLLLEETEEPILVVEAAFDAIAHWGRAVAVMGKPSAEQLDALAAARRPVVLALDGDAWLEGVAYALRLRLMGQRAASVRLPPGADPDEMPWSWLSEEARRGLEA